MATSRKEHCFIVNSFEEFEALARRALHQDLSAGDFELLDSSQCNGLCPTGKQCCHQSARCACGTTSGYFSCLCPRGQYGTGLRGDCKRKPIVLPILTIFLITTRLNNMQMYLSHIGSMFTCIPIVGILDIWRTIIGQCPEELESTLHLLEDDYKIKR